MKKVNELGRSMVEMLGVLAIIGVLSVGGIAGYTRAMKQYKKNDLQNAISMAWVAFEAQGRPATLNYTDVYGTFPTSLSPVNDILITSYLDVYALCGEDGCPDWCDEAAEAFGGKISGEDVEISCS